MLKILKYTAYLTAIIFLLSCEDPVPNDYEKEYIVTAFLIVDKPLEEIIVMETQPLTETFNHDSSLVKDARVKISTETDSWLLSYRTGKKPGYFFPDTSVKVQPETKYSLEIILPDSTFLTGETITPPRFDWVVPPKDFIRYPSDTLNPPFIDTIVFSWQAVPDVEYYLIEALCLDTLDYGKYLSPPTTEINHRVYRPFASEESYRELSAWAFIPSTATPVVWNFFKWFGRHKAAVYAPDPNMLDWFRQYLFKSSYDPLLSTIEGGKGCFGSASMVQKEIFLLKNEPEE